MATMIMTVTPTVGALQEVETILLHTIATTVTMREEVTAAAAVAAVMRSLVMLEEEKEALSALTRHLYPMSTNPKKGALRWPAGT